MLHFWADASDIHEESKTAHAVFYCRYSYWRLPWDDFRGWLGVKNQLSIYLISYWSYSYLPLQPSHCSLSSTDVCKKKCENQPNLTPETTKTHWNHASTISWHIITWLTNNDLEEWREFAVFRDPPVDNCYQRKFIIIIIIIALLVCLVVDNCCQR